MKEQQALIEENLALKATLEAQRLELLTSKKEIERLNELVQFFQRMKFAPSSEKDKNPNQLRIFNEAEELAFKSNDGEGSDQEGFDSDKKEVKGYTRKRGKRKPLPEDLEREDVIIELPEEERVCPDDGTPLVEIGEEVSEKLDIIPAVIKVIRCSVNIPFTVL
ncbi:MAG: IS66 family transposase zinc-finger binding domain-containing protein [Bacteriovoracaceae bacterium]|nr:IS66 family transposase zinc-finger binding domain-containing protein [Bacteriovoracaceae bacterium]